MDVNTLVAYVSHTGNTRRIAEAIAAELKSLGSTMVLPADEVSAIGDDVDLVLIGGPTEQHGATIEIAELFARVPEEAFRGRACAAFDTRLRWPHWLSGSAASNIAERLEECGAHLVAPPESFIVSMKPELEPGEEQRAQAWAAMVAHHVETSATLAVF
jgi:flavodoxin